MRPSLLLLTLAVVAAVLAAGLGSASAAGACPTTNPPNELIVVGGSLQTAQLDTIFQTNLQVALTNTNGCPLTGTPAGIPVEFDAPGSSASGTFANTGTNAVTAGTDAQGAAAAPAFTANDIAGSYAVDAHSAYGSVRLYLTNTASGLPAGITATGTTSQEAAVNAQYSQPLQVQVKDADGRPVQAATVAFTLGIGMYGAGASFVT